MFVNLGHVARHAIGGEGVVRSHSALGCRSAGMVRRSRLWGTGKPSSINRSFHSGDVLVATRVFSEHILARSFKAIRLPLSKLGETSVLMHSA